MSDLVKRLREYNPPDRTIDEQRQIAVDVSEAADAIEQLQRELSEALEENAALRDLLCSAHAIAVRQMFNPGERTSWDRFAASIQKLGIGAVTPRTYRILPSDEEPKT